MPQATVKKGDRYFYNTKNAAVYPWAPDLVRVKGLIPFVAPEDGAFNIGMTLAQAQETAELDAEEAAEQAAKAKAEEEQEKADAAEATRPSVDEWNHGGADLAPTLGVTEQPD